ncbi:hypothetical protein DsansV1_C30g0215081 [Dioscorea sansibarensis]
MLGLFLSSPLWIFKLSHYISATFSSLFRLRNIVSGPKCLFFLFNIIIIFLVGESKLSKSSPAPDIYEEYVKRNERLRKLDMEDKKEATMIEEKKERDEEIQKEEEKKENEEMLVCDEEEDMEGEEEDEGMPLEELNRRAEDFIARVNMQRRLEASMLVSCA